MSAARECAVADFAECVFFARRGRPHARRDPCASSSAVDGDETASGSWTFLKKKQCEARVFPRVLMSRRSRGKLGA